MRRQGTILSVAAIAWLFVLSIACGGVNQSVAEDRVSSTTVKAAVTAGSAPIYLKAGE